MKVKVKKLHPNAQLPFKNHDGDACYDLFAVEDVIIKGGEIKKVHFGIAIEMPKGYEGVIRPRSSSFVKKNLNIHIGTIDNQYRGELVCAVSLIKQNDITGFDGWHRVQSYIIKRGEAIAQIAFRKVPEFEIVEVDELSDTERGDGGFGSTG